LGIIEKAPMVVNTKPPVGVFPCKISDIPWTDAVSQARIPMKTMYDRVLLSQKDALLSFKFLLAMRYQNINHSQYKNIVKLLFIKCAMLNIAVLLSACFYIFLLSLCLRGIGFDTENTEPFLEMVRRWRINR